MVPIALALGLGFLLGLGVGALQAFRLAARRRAIAGLNAGLARLWPETLPGRSAADILAGRIRIQLGGEVYELPVLPRAASRRWLQSLDGQFSELATDLEAAGDDAPRILALLSGQSDALFDILASYDQTAILPTREAIEEFATDTQILRAVLEVWRAANPLAATLAERTGDEPTNGGSPEPPTTSPRPMAGVPNTSSTS